MKKSILSFALLIILGACSPESSAPSGAMESEASTISDLIHLTSSFLDEIRNFKGINSELAESLESGDFQSTALLLNISPTDQIWYQSVLDRFESSESISFMDLSPNEFIDWNKTIHSIQTNPEWLELDAQHRAPKCTQAYYVAVQSCVENPNFFMACFLQAYCTHCSGEGVLLLCDEITI